jgi:uncharacterized membrane protein
MDPLGAIFFGIGSYQIGETYCSIAYPVLPWLAMMVFGWCFGRVLVDARETQSQPALPLGVIGVALLILFVVVRGLNGFGNMGLLRADASLVEWLHVSKYPPSLSSRKLRSSLYPALRNSLRISYAPGRKWLGRFSCSASGSGCGTQLPSRIFKSAIK